MTELGFVRSLNIFAEMRTQKVIYFVDLFFVAIRNLYSTICFMFGLYQISSGWSVRMKK